MQVNSYLYFHFKRLVNIYFKKEYGQQLVGYQGRKNGCSAWCGNKTVRKGYV
jgi:hypothetical protein